jgi:hypothetical protein
MAARPASRILPRPGLDKILFLQQLTRNKRSSSKGSQISSLSPEPLDSYANAIRLNLEPRTPASNPNRRFLLGDGAEGNQRAVAWNSVFDSGCEHRLEVGWQALVVVRKIQ